MTHYFFKAASAAELQCALLIAGVIIEVPDLSAPDPTPILAVADGFAVDVIGAITKPSADNPDELFTLDGYHANLAGELSEWQVSVLAPVLLPAAPANPYRVWAS